MENSLIDRNNLTHREQRKKNSREISLRVFVYTVFFSSRLTLIQSAIIYLLSHNE